MKATLQFDLEDSEDQMSHRRMLKATDMACVLFEIQNNLRKQCDIYTDGSIESEEILDTVFNKINDLMQKRNINLEEIIN